MNSTQLISLEEGDETGDEGETAVSLLQYLNIKSILYLKFYKNKYVYKKNNLMI